jgi:hypothetical protein
VKKLYVLLTIMVSATGCAGPQVTKILPLTDSADAPYDNVLVVSLFQSFDNRRYLENAIVDQLAARGVSAVASTSKMKVRAPVNRDTIVALVEELGSDAVLLTQLVDLTIESKEKNMRPEATYNVRSTSYYNVWSVDLTEYREPKNIEFKNTVLLSIQMFSVRTQEPVWAIETTSTIKQNMEARVGEAPIVDEARAIVRQLERDGLLAR